MVQHYQKFKVGDRVKLIAEHYFDDRIQPAGRYGLGTYWHGQGVLEVADAGGDVRTQLTAPHVIVRPVDGSSGHWCQESALEFVDPPVSDEELQEVLASIRSAGVSRPTCWRCDQTSVLAIDGLACCREHFTEVTRQAVGSKLLAALLEWPGEPNSGDLALHLADTAIAALDAVHKRIT